MNSEERKEYAMEIAGYGVFGTPAVIVDGEVKCVEKIPKKGGNSAVDWMTITLTPSLHNNMWKSLLPFENMNQSEQPPGIFVMHPVGFAGKNNDFLMLFPLRESRSNPYPALPRDCSRLLRRHPWRLGSESLRLLQRWG
jgi:hypothetical protein